VRIQRISDYRTLIQEGLKRRGASGRGQTDRLAKALGVSASQVSQVFSGARVLTLEQACNLAQFLELTKLETEYFLGLVQLERTSSAPLKEVFKAQLERTASLLDAQEESERLDAPGFVLDEADRGVFYSQWYYSAIRLLTAVPGMDTAEKISRRLGLPLKKTQEVLDFLLKTRLCVKKEGKIALGPSRTYAQRGSPFHGRHHLNWRVKAMEYLPREQPDGMSYTAAVSLSAEDAQKIRQILVEATDKAEALIEASPAKTLYCLTLDWFEV
jgi:uncharacterized protein (TIGR02147 family)